MAVGVEEGMVEVVFVAEALMRESIDLYLLDEGKKMEKILKMKLYGENVVYGQ